MSTLSRERAEDDDARSDVFGQRGGGQAASPVSLPEHSLAFLRLLLARARRLRLSQTAASLTLLSLLALVPVFTIALSLFGALPVLAPLRASLLDFFAANFFLPSFSETLVRYLNQFAGKVSELSLLGAAAFLTTAFSALLTIDRALNRIWMTRSPRALTHRLTIYWTFLTLGPVLLAAGVAVNGIFVSEFLAGTSGRGAGRIWLSIIPWLMSVGGLALLYRIVPNAPVPWRHALCGALLAAIALDLTKRVFAFQIAKLPTYTVVYGAFAALPLFLMWLFAFWLTVLAGALVAATVPRWRAPFGGDGGGTAASEYSRACRVLEALLEHARAEASTVTAGQLAGCFSNDPKIAEKTVVLLSDLGYLERCWPVGGSSSSSLGVHSLNRALPQSANVPARDTQGRGGVNSTVLPLQGWRETRLDEMLRSSSIDSIWQERWALRPGATSMSLRPLFDRLWFGGDSFGAPPVDLAAIDRPLGELRR